MKVVKMRCSKDKQDVIEGVKEQLRRRQRRLSQLTKEIGPYDYDKGPDRDQYNFVHGMVYAYREILYCMGVSAKEVDEIAGLESLQQ